MAGHGLSRQVRRMGYEVAVVRYEKPLDSLRKAVDLADGLHDVSSTSRVFIKPNFCLWREGVDFPKYGVLTTARLIEDMVVLLKERDVKDITILEGAVEFERKPESTLRLVARGMGLDLLEQRYGVRMVDVLRSTFTKVTAGDVQLSVNSAVLEADYLINMPVLKTHSQAMVSLGIKNLKGMLSIPSRKMCHNTDPSRDLNYHLAQLPAVLPPSLTVIDGIYSLERGPLITGRAYRSNVILASRDVISVDKVASTVLGIEPHTVPHLVMAAKNSSRQIDLGDVDLAGDVDIKTALTPHQWEFEQNAAGDLPQFFDRAGIKGLTYPPADTTMCTYCADFIYYVIWGILMSGNKDEPFDDIEILHGKLYDPSGTHKHTLLVGKCQVKRNGENPLVNHCVRIRGCPPSKKDLLLAYAELGIDLPDDFVERMERSPEILMRKYADNPEFDATFYQVR